MSDIISITDDDYIVTGFFTPDYLPLARSFSANLKEHKIPHHLYSISAADWAKAILMKPHIVGYAMDDYPKKTIVLSDIDCVFRGRIDQINTMQCDVAFHTRCKLARRVRKFQPWKTKRRASIWPSARFVVFKNNAQSLSLISRWRWLCNEQTRQADPWDDEILLQKAISETGLLLVQQLPDTLAAHECDEAAPDALVVHKSAHDAVRFADKQRRKFKLARRWLFRGLFGEPA